MPRIIRRPRSTLSFNKVYGGQTLLTPEEIRKFKTAMLVEFATMDHEAGWTQQQFHYGAIRKATTAACSAGWVPIRASTRSATSRSAGRCRNSSTCSTATTALRRPSSTTSIPATTSWWPRCSATSRMAVTAPGKIQFGSGWWFLDQKDGMERQMNALSLLGLLSRFVGMLTDSRSFLSYPRHEYFRRTLCNLVGNDIEHGGLLPASEIDFIGRGDHRGICYRNAKNYFKF